MKYIILVILSMWGSSLGLKDSSCMVDDEWNVSLPVMVIGTN